ncbi:MAG TPA: hypothetical protein VNH44_16920, partial [Micropepsaceae bacterium]|nr:hypothetical protein [Micropepsaceae bacterium]
MITLPNPFVPNSDDAEPCGFSPASRRVCDPEPASSEAESSMSTGGHQEAPAVEVPHATTAGSLDDIDCIGEIFHYARKLIDEDGSKLS